MDVGYFLRAWRNIGCSAARDAFEASEKLADSVFGDYTIEEKQLLLKYGVFHGEDKSVRRRVPAPEAFDEAEIAVDLRDRTRPVSDQRNGFREANRPSGQY